MSFSDFKFAANTQLYFGKSKFKLLAALINSFGNNLLLEWAQVLKIPLLGQFDVTGNDLDKIVTATSQKNNPVML